MNNKRNFYIETKEVCHWCNQDNCELWIDKWNRPSNQLSDYIVSMCLPRRWERLPRWMYLELRDFVNKDVKEHMDKYWTLASKPYLLKDSEKENIFKEIYGILIQGEVPNNALIKKFLSFNYHDDNALEAQVLLKSIYDKRTK